MSYPKIITIMSKPTPFGMLRVFRPEEGEERFAFFDSTSLGRLVGASLGKDVV